MEFWNSAEVLGKINTYLQIFLVGFGIATGLVGAASFFVGHRKASLDALHEEEFKEHVESIDERTSDVRALKGREFTAAQIEALKTALQGTTPVEVFAIRHNSKESQRYSSQIESAMEAVGWEVDRSIPLTSAREVSSPKVGVNKSLTELKEFNLLKAALEKISLPFKFGQFQGNIKQHIILDVGVVPANEYQALIDKIG